MCNSRCLLHCFAQNYAFSHTQTQLRRHIQTSDCRLQRYPFLTIIKKQDDTLLCCTLLPRGSVEAYTTSPVIGRPLGDLELM
ncbi:hypothetical protein CHARACLAT_032126 [Characodon lateralis]|uniref:Uncharacterized protein n=1 Tax=Characodon lateralis TaxID=208331 RepID=A0ABU7CWF4_9TELE|nr:hypothetical protein [Characodon lateralis]